MLTWVSRPRCGRLWSYNRRTWFGEIIVNKRGAATVFDFGEWSSEVASRKNPHGTFSFLTIVPGFSGLEFLVRHGTLTLRDAQHEYVYKATPTVTSAPR